VICHHRPVFALPNGKHINNNYLDHLWLKANDKNIPYSPAWHTLLLKKGLGFETLFGTADSALRFYEPFRIKSLRERAIKKCVNYILEHQEASGDWGGIFPPMMNGVLALTLEGYSLTSTPVAKGLKAIENFSWEDESGFRIQACVSPVWDTAWAAIALIDSHAQLSDERIKGAMDWILKNQIRVEYGDWKVYRPHLISGGWAFEYHNTWYPDVDDTAAVLLALIKQDPASVLRNSTCRAVEWVLGMQNRDGGWAAFDVNNDKLFLNKIPFSDMDSLCDTSCADITARVIEAFSLFLKQTKKLGEHPSDDMERRMRAACERAISYLRRTQEADGSWLGRWGVNYIYGTSHALCGLVEAGVSSEDSMVVRGLKFLQKTQNEDGGWGEAVESYDRLKFVAQASTASQTAWALLGLLAYSSAQDGTIQKGIEWLVEQQVATADKVEFEGGLPLPKAGGRTWNENVATGTGFPGHFYLRYHLYRHVFPMMALGRYLKALEN
jgi:squalene-hopene/tetraprenyl-beta-curcumene cyclase